jgi:hypothetical protein
MSAKEKSDLPEVARKRANKAVSAPSAPPHWLPMLRRSIRSSIVVFSRSNVVFTLPRMKRISLVRPFSAIPDLLRRVRHGGLRIAVASSAKKEAGLARGVVLMDAGYGCNTNLRTSVSALALCYVMGHLPFEKPQARAKNQS